MEASRPQQTPQAPPRVLGQLLLSAGAIAEAELSAALAEQRRTRERLGEVLVRRGADPEAIARALACQLRMSYIEPPLEPEQPALRLVDGALAARLRIVPLAIGERGLRVAMADPLDAAAIDDLQFQTGRRIEAVVALPSAVEAALAAYQGDAVDAILTRLPKREAAKIVVREESPDVAALRRASEAPPIVSLVELVLTRAVKQRASDIHVEPAEGSLRVRVRVDGVLRELLELPARTGGAFISRIKIMADLDIAVKRRPQDGRATVQVDGRELALRVSTLPAQGGEKIVIRVLESGATMQRLDSVGMTPEVLARFGRLLGRSHGVILVTGPTGSGKTTTLYAALASLDRERRNLVTLEDPVEYRLPGLTQVQVHRRAGLGFGAALRAVLRQDPDVIMVGELRDKETVEIAMAAALTGHLVLSTLHTNDAPTAATRLAEMGAAPYLVAAGLIGVLAQRLARRLCEHCRVRRTAESDELEALGLPAQPVTLYEPGGCGRCEGSGYRGRLGIFELLTVTGSVRDRILRRAPTDAIREAGRTAGLLTLGQDAWLKARAGLTGLEEVRPLLSLLADEAALCPRCSQSVRAAHRFCPGCGFGLRRRCSCGAALEEGWQWCPRCGGRAAPGSIERGAADD
jgi:type IV pilus assembly protein PilB